MASNPPGSCCYQGVKHEGEATGEFSQLGDFEVYTKKPDSGDNTNGILIITDVIGHRFINAQLIADQFAANGYFVLMPGLFQNDPIKLNRSPDFDIDLTDCEHKEALLDILVLNVLHSCSLPCQTTMKWLQGEYNETKRPHLPPQIDPIIDACVKELRGKYGVKKIGAVGYCFGGKYVVRGLQPGKFDAGYVAHPSFVEEEEIKNMKGPLSIAAAETDSIFPNEKRHITEDLLRESKLPYQINLYSGVEHGFAVRGDPQNRQHQYAKETAFIQAIQWFEEHLKGPQTK